MGASTTYKRVDASCLGLTVAPEGVLSTSTMPTFQDYLSGIKGNIKEMDAGDLKAQLESSKAVVIDVREESEYKQGFIPGSTWISRGILELKIEDAVPDRDTELVLYCAGGVRSALA